MSFGFIQIPRSLLNDPIWKSLPYTYRHVFLTILEHMAFKETMQDDFGTLTLVKPGQLLITERRLVELCNEPDIDKSLVHRSFLKFKKLGFSNHTSNHKKTLITITRSDICELIEPGFEPNSNQTRTIKEQRQEREQIKEQQPPTPFLPSVGLSVGSVVVFFDCLVSVQISDEDKRRLMALFDEITLIRAITVLNERKTPPDNITGFLIEACKKGYSPKQVFDRKEIKYLSENAKKNRKTILSFQRKFNEQLRIKDIGLNDMLDHVNFGGTKIFYESMNFNREVGEILKRFNLLYLVKNEKQESNIEEKIVCFKNAAKIANQMVN